MIVSPSRVPPRSLRRSRRPGRGRNPHAARRAPIVFCLMPPIGSTVPSSGELAGGGDATAVGDVAAELARDLEGEREPGRRPADLAEVDPDAEREPDLRVLVDEDADDRALRVGRVRHRPHGHVRSLSSRRSVSRTVSPGRCRPITRRSSGGVRTWTPSTETMTSSGCRTFAAGHVGGDARDQHAARRRERRGSRACAGATRRRSPASGSSRPRSAAAGRRRVVPAGASASAGTSVVPSGTRNGNSRSSVRIRRM